MTDWDSPQHHRSNLSGIALTFSAASVLLAAPAVYQGSRLLKATKPLMHTTLLFRAAAIPCLVCALIGLFLGTRGWGGRFAAAAVVLSLMAIVAVLLIALLQ